jgi:hypothetical protein
MPGYDITRPPFLAIAVQQKDWERIFGVFVIVGKAKSKDNTYAWTSV